MTKQNNMKRYRLLSIVCAGLLGLTMGCENKEIAFPDYGETTVYFAYQYPVRTIVFGEDIYDTSLDNQGRCEIYATMGGAYSNKQTIDIQIEVDNALCDNLYFDSEFNSPVRPMPTDYYTLSASQISLDRSLQGSVGVQLTDAFFADPDAYTNTFVIPLKMVNATNADAILSGVPKVDEPLRSRSSDWDVVPKDYVLYCVKFINTWDANYLRRGKDQITENGVSRSVTRHQPTVEKDPVISLHTLSLNEIRYPMDYKNEAGLNLNLALKLAFDESEKCAVLPLESSYALNDSVQVNNVTATGNGAFVKKGEKNSWGNKDRDVLYLEYNVSYEVETKYPTAGLPDKIEQVTYATSDTLVVRDRGVKAEVFTPSFKE